MKPEIKKIIDGMDYKELLYKWRFAPTGDSMFEGDMGIYFQKVMGQKRLKVGLAAHVAVNKAIGWNN